MAPLPAVFRETKVSSISFFLIGPSGARKHHINSSLKRFIYKSVIFMEAVETEYVFFASVSKRKINLTGEQRKTFVTSAPPTSFLNECPKYLRSP